MTLNDKMNWIDIDTYIIDQMKAGTKRETIENNMMKAFKWTQRQAYAATDPYYDEKLLGVSEGKVRRK